MGRPACAGVVANVWVAGHDEHDPEHRRCADLLRQRAGELSAPATVVTETAWQLEDRYGSGAEAKFLRLITAGTPSVVDLTAEDRERCVELSRPTQNSASALSRPRSSLLPNVFSSPRQRR